MMVYLVCTCDDMDYITSRCPIAVYSTESAAKAFCEDYNSNEDNQSSGDTMYWCEYDAFKVDKPGELHA